MKRRLLPMLALIAGLPAAAEETLAVLAAADPPGPEPELAEMTHQLRAACRERTGGLQEVPEMRQRLLGQSSNATLAELERAYGGAQATYQNGEYQSAIRTLYAILEDLERLPEGPEAYSQWIRAQLRLAHAEGTVGHVREEREAMERVLAVEPRHQPDPDQYSPTYRRDFEAARARVAARPRRRITVDALGWAATVYLNGRPAGTSPVTLSLPPGRYRIGGSAGTLRVPSAWVALRDEDRSVALDFGLADALRVSAGPGLALSAAQRAAGIVRAGAWLGVDRVLAASIATENDVQFLVGSLYDIRRGALQREGRVRMAAGAVPTPNLGALAAFLLTGQQSKVVVVARATPPPPPPAQEPARAEPPVAAVPLPAPPLPQPAPRVDPPAPAAPRPAEGAASPPGPVAGPEAPPPTKAAARGDLAAAASRPAARAAPARASGPTAAPASPRPPPPPSPSPPAAQAPPRADPPLDLRPAAPPAPPARVEPMGPTPAGDAGGAPAGPRAWMRPAAWASGALAVGLVGLTGWNAMVARGRDRDADAMLRADGSLRPGADAASYDRLRASAASSRRGAWMAAAGAAALAAATGTLVWLSAEEPAGPAIRF